MSYITLGQNQSVQGFNNYRLGTLRSQGMGALMSNSSSLYGIPSRYGNGSWFASAQGRSYNSGPVGRYYQMPEPEPPKKQIWKDILKGVGGAVLGIGVGWLMSGDNAKKTGNWISNLFSNSNSETLTPLNDIPELTPKSF